MNRKRSSSWSEEEWVRVRRISRKWRVTCWVRWVRRRFSGGKCSTRVTSKKSFARLTTLSTRPRSSSCDPERAISSSSTRRRCAIAFSPNYREYPGDGWRLQPSPRRGRKCKKLWLSGSTEASPISHTLWHSTDTQAGRSMTLTSIMFSLGYSVTTPLPPLTSTTKVPTEYSLSILVIYINQS